MYFFWILFYKAQLCGVYGLKWSYGQILRVIFGLFVPSLINALLAWSMSFGGWPSLGRFVVVPYSFHCLIVDLMVLRWMFNVSDVFITQP